MSKIIVIAGPTASGKTDLSVHLAKRFKGEIINADSMQIYKEMDIGTAKPSKEEMAGVLHHLMGFLSPLDSFSVKEYVDLAHPIIQQIITAGKVPIIVGGTGMYINSLVDCTSFSNHDSDPAITNRLNILLENEGAIGLHRALEQVDPQLASQLHPNNTRRVFRALELYHLTGVIPSKMRKEAVSHSSIYEPLMFAADFDREVLYERINLRVKKMLESGLVEEVRSLREMGCTIEHQSMQGIGYKETFLYLDGHIGLNELYEMICRNTRRYAKRQLTWFRRDQRILWQKNGFDCMKIESIADEFLNERGTANE